MMFQEECKCQHCNKTFYLNGFRLCNANTVSCLYCEKRTITEEGKKRKERLSQIHNKETDKNG